MDEVVNNSRERYYPALDGLRGMAALMIVWHHFLQLSTMHGAVLSFIERFLGFTWIGVDLFFALSGFLITGILVDSKSGKHYFRTFYGRRMLRIFPLYYGVLVIVLLVLPLDGVKTGVIPSSQVFFWTYTSNFYFAYAGWGANYLSHLWTLAIEEQFYLIWPLVIFLAGRLERLRTGLLWAFVSISILRCILDFSGVGFGSLYLETETHCDALILGGFLALSVRSLDSRALNVMRPNKFIVMFLVVLTFFALDNSVLFPAWDAIPIVYFVRNMITLPLLAILFVWLIYAATNRTSGHIFRFFSHPVLRWFGKYSYALYVLHVPLAFLVLRAEMPWISTISILAEFELFFIYFGACILFAFLSWHLYEKHFLKLKRYFQTGREISPN